MDPKVVLITGANRGIGHAILCRLVSEYPQYTYVLGTRSPPAGAAAISSLREADITASITVLPLDVTSQESIIAAATHVRNIHGGKLDVLINNAGVAISGPTNPDLTDVTSLGEVRESWSSTFDTNVFSVAIMCDVFRPLLTAAPAPRIINVSSGRASLSNSTEGKLPPTQHIAYSVSKVALNGLGIEVEKSLKTEVGESVRVWSVNPGHCKTGFNGFRGKRDPLDGAGVVVELLRGDDAGQRSSGFWEEKDGVVSRVPW